MFRQKKVGLGSSPTTTSIADSEINLLHRKIDRTTVPDAHKQKGRPEGPPLMKSDKTC